MKKDSRWVRSFETQVLRRKHVLLYGNIHDQFLYHGDYQSLNDILFNYFEEVGYEIICQYNPADGLNFTDNATKRSGVQSMSDRYDDIMRKSLSLDVAPPPGGAIPQVNPRIPNQPPPRQVPGPPPSASANGRMLKSVEYYENMRTVLRQNQVSVVAISDITDMLTSGSNYFNEDEKRSLILMKKCLLEAAILRKDKLNGYRNMMILVAGDLKRLPEWIYRDNPYVELIEITLPDKDERHQFAMQFISPNSSGQGGFFGGDSIANAMRSDPNSNMLSCLSEELSDLTEGMRTMDMETMRIASWQAGIPIAPKAVSKLVDYFKFGIKEDPWEKLSPQRVRTAREELSKSVMGQESAVDAVVTMLTSARIGLQMTGAAQSAAPKGVFFFVGPTGVGKTELAKALTKLVFGDEKAFARFDMSEYKEEHAAEKLAGAPPGFVGYDEGGQLTNRVMRQPHSILLFDEIEKAHPKVLDKFLQILEDGRLTDGKGQTAYFNQTAIIFTSNIGSSDITDVQTGHIIREGIMRRVLETGVEQFSYAEIRKHFMDEVQWYFTSRIGRAELLNRLGDNIVVFDMLRPQHIQAIGEKFVKLLAESAREKYHFTLQVNSSWYDFLQTNMMESDNILLGGRRVKTLTSTFLRDVLNEWIFNHVDDVTTLKDKTLKIGINQDYKMEVEIV